MKIKVTDNRFNDYGRVYDVEVTRRKLNGYWTKRAGDDEETFLCTNPEYMPFEILEISETEKNMPIDF